MQRLQLDKFQSIDTNSTPVAVNTLGFAVYPFTRESEPHQTVGILNDRSSYQAGRAEGTLLACRKIDDMLLIAK